MNVLPEWVQWVTFAGACIGTVLGVLNAWRAMTRDTPRIRVRTHWRKFIRNTDTQEVYILDARPAKSIHEYPGGQLAIEAINIGYVTVFITQAGVCPAKAHWFTRLSEFKEPRQRGQINSDAAGLVTLPHKLEPGESVKIVASRTEMNGKAMRRAGNAYVMTADERCFVGGGKLVRAIAKNAQAAFPVESDVKV